MAASPITLSSFPSHSHPSSPSTSPNRSNPLSSPTILNRIISQTAKPSHTCPSCARPFSRAEHLDRHLTTHLPSNSSKSFICPSCGKGFTRKDVLTRHVRAVHETKRSDVRRSRRRSCRRCAGFKIKCSGGARASADGPRGDEACEACKKRGVMCVYDFGSHSDGSTVRGGDIGKNSGTGSGDDDILDDVSEEDGRGPNGTSERISKRRKISDAYLDQRTSPAVSSVSHLLSAAMMASPTSPQRIAADLSMDDESFTAAATVASLVNSTSENGQRTPDMISAEHLMSMATNKTYEDLSGKSVSPRSALANGDKSSYFSQSPFSLAQSNKGSTTGFRQDTSRGSPLPRASLNPSQFVATLAQQASSSPSQRQFSVNSSPLINSTTSVRRSDEPLSNLRSLNSSFASVCVSQTSGLPGILSPPTFNVAGDTTSSPKLFSNVLLGPGDNRRDESLGDSVHLESNDNWFFDAGIFETDWLRWGGFSSDPLPTPEVEQMPTGVPLTERHMSTCSNISASGNIPSLTNSRPASGVTPKDICSPASTPSEYGAYPPNSKEVRLPSVSPIKDSSTVEDLLPWGWRATREEPKRRITLPPLRQILEECSSKRLDHSATTFSPRFTSADPNRVAARIGTVSDNIRSDLISVLKVPYARHPYYDDCDIEHKFPSKELIDGFIVLYFKHFHSILPMIHKPTFRVEKCPSILLVAMASIGASYSDIEGAKGFADGLSELCKRALTWMAEFDNEYLRSEYYLTAFCLQHAYALGSGHQALYDAADSTRSFLVANARRCGLFSDTTSPCTRPSSVPSSPRGSTIDIEEPPYRRGSIAALTSDEQQLNTRWLAWVEQEKRKRVVWAIFSYDSSFSTLSNRRGDISLNDIKSRLPCEEKMWEAPTAEAWAAMLPPPTALNASLAYRGMPFFPTLRDVIARKLDPQEIPSWGKELCAWALGRMLWDFKEMEQTAQGCGVNGISGLGLPALTEGLKQTKETALAALTALGEAAWKNGGGECDKVHSNLTSLIAHYSHLHFGVPTISLILSLARNPPSSPCMSKFPSETVEDARITRLRSIFSEDPVHARTIAWHAGQIIGISRYRPVHTPAETMRVFLAGVVLWGVAKWFVECRSMAAANTWTCGLNDGADIRLDTIPTPSPSNPGSSCGMPLAVAEWLRTGKGRATIRKDGDDAETGETQLCSERGAKEVLQVVVGILGKMRIWGLGAKFRRLLEVMGK